MNKVRWGILGGARIALNKVIPALVQSDFSSVHALASRTPAKSRQVCADCSIPLHFSSYEALLSCADVDAVYVPLPNDLHVHWAVKALEAGKHILVEKPVGMDAAEAGVLLEAANQRKELIAMEAFMYKFHPQWYKCLELIKAKRIGELQSLHTQFSYFNDDPANIRNRTESGGGALLDIGCYAVSAARLCFGSEPLAVNCAIKLDAATGVDTVCTGVLDFGSGHASFNCSTRSFYGQHFEVNGTKGKLSMQWPFNPDVRSGKEPIVLLLTDDGTETFRFEEVNQYQAQFDAMSKAILGGGTAPFPLQDAVQQMKIIDALKISAAQKGSRTAIC